MAFTSLQFFGFIPIAISLYFIIPQRFRWSVLLVSSYYFYLISLSVNVLYVSILILATVTSYIAGILIYKAENRKKKKIIFYSGVIFFTGLLIVFKYLNFLNDNLRSLLGLFNLTLNFPLFKLAIPLGISFYTFQILSYLIDIYNAKEEPIRHFGYYATGIAFFPKLLSGPIERSGNFYPQFLLEKEIEYKRVSEGVKLFTWGLFKKAVIADRLSYAVNLVFNNPGEYYGFSILFSILLLSIQIYSDFSGYTDMAIGISKIFGIKLSENFDRPYFSVSISDFWKKWHISLSFWLRDYIFLPLAYSFTRKIMKSKLKVKPEVISYIAGILITMFICGIWHGAKWTFIIWGLLHGFYLAFGFLLKKRRKKLYKRFKISNTVQKNIGIIMSFLLVSFAWIFFRVNSAGDSINLIYNFFNFSKTVNPALLFEFKTDFFISIISILILFAVENIQSRRIKRGEDSSISSILNIPVILILLISLFIFGKFEQLDFLYFSF
jgi:D-alanyl-lipoteichoic acid acyltransferase DltB (MBOAT superfamily)